MSLHTLARRQHLSRGREQAFEFFGDARNLEAITPPWLHFRVVTGEPIEMRPGTLIEYRLRLHGVPLRWLTRIEEWDPPRRFVDVQLFGPYRVWHHTHTFEHNGDGTLMSDEVRYALPLGPLGDVAHRLLVRGELERIFEFRQRRVAELLARSGQLQ